MMRKMFFALSVCCIIFAATACSSESKQNQPTATPQNDVSAQSVAASASLQPDSGQDYSPVLDCLIGLFSEDEITLRATGKKLEIYASSQDLSDYVTLAKNSGESPENWAADAESWSIASMDAMTAAAELGIENTILYVVNIDNSSEIYATFLNGKNTYSLFETYEYSGYNPPTISLEEYNQIKTGMEYQEVFDIIGSRGEELAASDLGFSDEYYTVIFTWDGDGTLGANANVTFQGGKVTSKAQAGLE